MGSLCNLSSRRSYLLWYRHLFCHSCTACFDCLLCICNSIEFLLQCSYFPLTPSSSQMEVNYDTTVRYSTQILVMSRESLWGPPPKVKPPQPSGGTREVPLLPSSAGAVTPLLVLASTSPLMLAAARVPESASAGDDPLTLTSAVVEPLVSHLIFTDPAQSTSAAEVPRPFCLPFCQMTKEI